MRATIVRTVFIAVLALACSKATVPAAATSQSSTANAVSSATPEASFWNWFVAHRDEMAARFDAARRSGDSVHRREEARFRLLALKDAAGAVALARENWKVQREPADLRILVQAARAANDPAALALAQDWIARTHLDDRTLVAAMAGAR